MIIVKGSLKTGNYTDNEGVKRYVTDIEANSVYFAANKSKTDDSGYYPDCPPPDTTQDAQAGMYELPADDDYPF